MNKITNEDILKYEDMISYFIKNMVIKNFSMQRPISTSEVESMLGNSGLTLEDIRQNMRVEVFKALSNYDKGIAGHEGRVAKESTFVYGHLWKRFGSLLNKITGKGAGYNVSVTNIDDLLTPNKDS
jgi:hypothetical protein